MEINLIVTQLAALAQETRLRIFRLLVAQGQGGMTPGALSEQLALPAATLSFHLKELTRAGLLQADQQGRFIYYRANYPQMNQLIGYLTENCCAGEPCEISTLNNCCEVETEKSPLRNKQ